MSDTKVFPQTFNTPNGEIHYYGLTHRELFDLAAMQGVIVSLPPDATIGPEGVAHDALLYTDALINAMKAGAEHE